MTPVYSFQKVSQAVANSKSTYSIYGWGCENATPTLQL